MGSTDTDGRTPLTVIPLNVRLPSERRYGGAKVLTGGVMRPVPRATLRLLGFDGDGQGELVNQNGEAKAVWVYTFDHYPHWGWAPGREPEPRTFSENLRVLGVEIEVAVCDVFRVGGAIMQVSRGRRAPGWPGKNGKKLLVREVAQSGYTGLYVRVLSEGVVAVSDVLECNGRCRDPISITHVNDVICDRTHDSSLVEQPANLPEFTAGGRALFARRLERRMNREERTGRRVRAGEGVSWV